METKIIYRSISSAFLILFMVIAGFSQAQLHGPSVTEVSINEKKSECDFLKFTVRSVDKNVFLNWSVINRSEESVFVIEHSVDGVDYKSLGLKEGVISPGEIPLLFCWTHEHPLSQNNYYRIKFFGEDGSIILSDPKYVKISEPGLTNVFEPIKEL